VLGKTADLPLNPVEKFNTLSKYFKLAMIYHYLHLKPTIKQMSGRKRNWAKANGLILTGRNKNDAHECAKYLMLLKNSIHRGWRLVRAKKIGKGSVERLVKLYKLVFHRFITEMTLLFDLDDVDLGVERRGEPATIDGWSEVRIPEDLRVHTRDDLWRLFCGFQFGERYVSKGRNVFGGGGVLVWPVSSMSCWEI
jgi:hypothetical protein